jgi:hypothetical protein
MYMTPEMRKALADLNRRLAAAQKASVVHLGK